MLLWKGTTSKSEMRGIQRTAYQLQLLLGSQPTPPLQTTFVQTSSSFQMELMMNSSNNATDLTLVPTPTDNFRHFQAFAFKLNLSTQAHLCRSSLAPPTPDSNSIHKRPTASSCWLLPRGSEFNSAWVLILHPETCLSGILIMVDLRENSILSKTVSPSETVIKLFNTPVRMDWESLTHQMESLRIRN